MKRVLIALVFSVLACPLGAQTIRGALTGTVTDSTGALVPGASVTVTNKDTNISDTAVTNLGSRGRRNACAFPGA